MLIKKEHKKIVLHLQNKERVLSVIPGAKILPYKGAELVVVPHRTHEVKILNNLGIAAPYPINQYYPYPMSRGEPFAHQRVTSEFLTMHPRAYCLNDMGCVDSDTEYLSPTGWVRISEYNGGQVAQYHPETGESEFVDPTEYVKLPCDTMLHVKTKYGIDQMLSPEHRVLLEAKGSPGKTEVIQAVDLFARHERWLSGANGPKSTSTVGWSKAAIPVTFRPKSQSDGVALSDAELRVQIAVIADGHFPSSTNRCVVRLKKSRKVNRMRDLLTDAGIAFSERNQDTPTAVGYTVFTFVAPWRVKEFTMAFWGATYSQLSVVCDEVMHWDGSISDSKPTERFSTFVKASADFVQYAFSATGRTARVLEGTRERRGGIEVEYTVQVRPNGGPLQLCSLDSSGSRRSVMSWVPSTDGFKYCFMVPSTFLLFRRNGCVFASGNTGKTLSVLWAYDFMRSEGAVKKLLVMSPLSTLEETWGNTLFRNFPHLTFAVLHGSREKRRALLASDYDVYIINHDGVKILEKEIMEKTSIDAFVIDEIAQVGRNITDKWKAIRNIVKGKPIVWGLTGTPTPNSPEDAWAQCRLVTPDTVPPVRGRFKDMVMRRAGPFRWVAREGALEIVHKAMQPSIRYKRDDCIDLPPCTYETRSVEMTTDQKNLYKHMLTKLHAELNGCQITAANEAVKAMKLVQIATGVVYGNEGQAVYAPATSRLSETHDVIESAGGKVIVFVPFTSALEAVATHLRKSFTVEVVNGQTSKGERDRIFREFQNDENPRVLVANAGAMAHGLTLTAADTIVWFAPINSLEIYEQANARITRPGQKRNQLIVHIEGSPVERAIYERLQTKGKMQGLLLKLVEEARATDSGGKTQMMGDNPPEMKVIEYYNNGRKITKTVPRSE